jgi:hypothetical protein
MSRECFFQDNTSLNEPEHDLLCRKPSTVEHPTPFRPTITRASHQVETSVESFRSAHPNITVAVPYPTPTHRPLGRLPPTASPAKPPPSTPAPSRVAAGGGGAGARLTVWPGMVPRLAVGPGPARPPGEAPAAAGRRPGGVDLQVRIEAAVRQLLLNFFEQCPDSSGGR